MVYAKSLGKCTACGQFGTIVEEVTSPEPVRAQHGFAGTSGSAPRKLADIQAGGYIRITVAMQELSRVLGGGIVPGSIVLISGDPGIGKSTLLTQMALSLSSIGDILYVSGEESEEQIKARADRLAGGTASGNVFLYSQNNLEAILQQAASLKPALLIVDSIQTTYTCDVDSSAGSPSQIRECAARLTEYAKTSRTPVFLVGHVTKDGDIAGPKVLEHIVDTVLHFEGDQFQIYRLLRAEKNRFGATNEVGVFEMTEAGLLEVSNPSAAFLANRATGAPGSAIAITLEGARPVMVEVQGLTVPVPFANPRRIGNGVDRNRMQVITAVLQRRVGEKLGENDVTVNVAGGLRVEEPALDLPMALAVASAYQDRPIHPGFAAFGEVGLAGELRPVGQSDVRLREADRMGFSRVIVPTGTRLTSKSQPVQILYAQTLADAIQLAIS
jgi:DNA repair protein RadA